MRFAPRTFTDRAGRAVLLRSPEPADAAALLDCLKRTSGETPYLLRDPEEITLTVAQEEAFLQNMLDDPHCGMLVADLDGQILGSASLSLAGPCRRMAHRCDLAIALYRDFWGQGLGHAMMQTLLDTAPTLGYTQAELQVVCDNHTAIGPIQEAGLCGMRTSAGISALSGWPACRCTVDGQTAVILYKSKRVPPKGGTLFLVGHPLLTRALSDSPLDCRMPRFRGAGLFEFFACAAMPRNHAQRDAKTNATRWFRNTRPRTAALYEGRIYSLHQKKCPQKGALFFGGPSRT